MVYIFQTLLKMTKKEAFKILKKDIPNLSDEELAHIYTLLIKLATIEFEFYQENNP